MGISRRLKREQDRLPEALNRVTEAVNDAGVGLGL